MGSPKSRSSSEGAEARPAAEGYYALSIRILRYGNRGTPRADFAREVSALVLDHAGADAVELRVTEGDKVFLAETTRGPARYFRFGVSDVQRGDKGKRIPCTPDDKPVEELYRNVSQGRFEPNLPYYTPTGVFWTGDALQTPLAGSVRAGGRPPANGSPRDAGYRSWVVAPFTVGGDEVGLLALKSRRKGFFSAAEAALYGGVAQNVGIAAADRRTHGRLRERVKELTCLYGIARLSAQPTLSVEEFLRRVVALLPPAMQYPEITVARVELDGVPYATEEYQETPYELSAPVNVKNEARGSVVVGYEKEKLHYEPGVFLEEEQSLIDAVANYIGLLLERRFAEEEKAHLQKQLRHADRLATIGQLAAGVAHELNEPLASVMSFAELVQNAPRISPQASADADKILTAALHAREVVKKLLFFARQVPTIKTAVNLNDVVTKGLALLSPGLQKGNIKYEVHLAPDLPVIAADGAQLQQVVVNLAVNALQAMPQGGKLVVSTRAEGDYVQLTVADTGVGMSEETLANAFLPFFTTKGVGQGTGLGLSVVHGIVTGHGGVVAVASELGRGTRFDVKLPSGGGGGGEP